MDKGKVDEPNHLQDVREELLMSRAELARRAGISPLTVKRIEDGKASHPRTKRAILEALSIHLEDRDKVFPRQRSLDT